MEINLTCSVCGKDFTGWRRDQKRCSDCHAKRIKSGSRSEASKASSRRRDKQRVVDRIQGQVFIGLDGEGFNKWLWEDPDDLTNPNGSKNHQYQYMAAADTTGETYELSPVDDWGRPRRIRTWEAFNWLWDITKGKSCWFFSGKYDWTHIFWNLVLDENSRADLWQILHPEQYPDGSPRDNFEPVWIGRWKNWGIVYTQGAVKMLRRYWDRETQDWLRDEKGNEIRPSRFFQDAFRCFGGGSFVANLKSWDVGTAEQHAQIESMKDKRAQFDELTDEVKEYCLEEVRLLAQLAQKVTGIFAEVGIHPRGGNWYSAGSAAKALMRFHHVEDYRGPDRFAGAPDELRDILLRTYYGGRFEIAETGIFDELWSDDFKSAYPAVIKTLPCLAHGHWEDHYVPGAVNMAHVTWEPADRDHFRWGPFPWRWPDGKIYYPLEGEGWYVEAEFRAACRLKDFDVQAVEWISFIPECDHKPFEWVQEVYDLRLQFDKDGSGRGIAIKVTLNSVYGVTADTIAADSKFASIIWASLITGGTRAKILHYLAEHGDEIVAVATDGIMSTRQINTVKTKVLGELNHEGSVKDVLLIQPGMYLAAEGADPKKTYRNRGHSLKKMKELEAELREAWLRDGWSAKVEYEQDMLIPAKLALQRKDPIGQFGQWVPTRKSVTFRPSSREIVPGPGPRKRSEPSQRHVIRAIADPHFPTCSAPYSRLRSVEANQDMIDAKELRDAQPGN